MSFDADTAIDRIYEAALVPELWRGVIDSMALLSDSATGGLFFFSPRYSARGVASLEIDAAFQRSIQSAVWAESPRVANIRAIPMAGFVRPHDFMSAEELARDPVQGDLRGAGLDAQIGTFVAVPNGDIACFTFERRLGQGRHSDEDIARIDRMRPHLARGAVLAARIGLDRAHATVAALDVLGLPAAALTATGKALAVSPLLENHPMVQPAAHGYLTLAHPDADALLQQALGEATHLEAPTVRSIALPATLGGAPSVLHLVPIRGAAHDLFTHAAFLLVMTTFGASAALPDLSLLHGLFDLTPREALLAAALATGKTLQEAAVQCGIQYSTARTHLEHIFRKTGVKQQTQLVLLLQGAHSLRSKA